MTNAERMSCGEKLPGLIVTVRKAYGNLREEVYAPIIAYALLSVTLILTLGAGAIFLASLRVQNATEVNADRIALALAKYVEQYMKRGDELLRRMNLRYRASPDSIQDWLQMEGAVAAREGYPLLAILGVDGSVVAASADSSDKISRQPGFNASEHLEFHRGINRDDLFLSGVIPAQSSGKVVVQLSRAFRAADGHLLGIGVVSVDLGGIIETYRSINGPYSVISVIGADGIGRIRVTLRDLQVGTDYSRHASFQAALQAALQAGNTIARIGADTDRVSRLYMFRKVTDIPLVVAIGVSTRIFQYVLIGIGTVSLTISFLVIASFAVYANHLLFELRNRNRALKASLDAVERVSNSKTHFIASVSHELRTPLHGILGHAQLLSRELPEGPQQESAAVVFSSANHLRDIVSQLLDIARANAGGEVYSFERIRPDLVLDELCALHDVTAMNKDVKLLQNYSSLGGVDIVTDRIALKRALNNLLTNSIKFTNRGGSVWISGDIRDGEAIIQFSDSGVGMSQDALSRMFQPYQSALSTPFGERGSGLGLTLTKQVIEDIGGTLAVTSIESVGSTFTVRLPLVARTHDPKGDGMNAIVKSTGGAR